MPQWDFLSFIAEQAKRYLWMRLPRRPTDPGQTLGWVDAGRIFVMLNREDYWQCAYVIPKGGFDQIRQGGLTAFRGEITRLAPYLGDRVGELDDWSDIKLLTVAVDRLRVWQFWAEATTRRAGGKNYPAWTRVRRDNIAFAFIENDQPLFEIVDTIVSEHYDDRDPNAARLMERFYHGHKWGWLRWERWEKTGTPPSDLIKRCPYVWLSEYPSGGGRNWRMVDCGM